ncbi:adenosine deaminase [Nocardia sp. SYP-A9097]|uniref:adenosine deaminase n=1 Tax=Nocardia sp. SYP-A9097 TaxID=2663237 RepID=UPI00129B0D61|nr:adenosine deaminase [Nocardia sp. SYP-A9097]MRH86983.1 adenosine deaminase [Nocardia sp. SYP-A9097]
MTIPFRELPKVSLHCHLTGSVLPETVAALARKHGVPMPGGRTAADLYDIDSHVDLDEFLRVYDMVGQVVRDADDFHRITYESLTTLGSEHGVLHREIFVSPPAHPGVDYRTLLDGIRAGMREAEQDTGIGSRIIIAVNREDTPAAAVDLVRTVIEQRCDEVVGIGLDYAEVQGPPQLFHEAYRIAGRAGLNRTAHSESGPPPNIEILLDVLGCTRVDHGYHVVDSPRITDRCREEGIVFTCTPVSSDIGRYSGNGNGEHEKIAAMVEAGLRVTIDSDDPPMFGTDPTNDFEVLHKALGYDADQLLTFTVNAIAGAWLDESDKSALRGRVRKHLTPVRATVG